ncbi:MAG: hypothetical protein ISS41_01795 [Candidatus Aminicenantes bacterium]|nr:hypothetical protein [Candidatus Aminicenantes bacterium]MBL7082347.1 hypothetical protein [Candidatus Aminicenantes bacterium]
MAKCSKCNERKGKRHCAALGDYLCSLCCGKLREKEIHCPQDCTFLEQHRPYQEKRIIDKKQDSFSRKRSPDEDILKDERMAWLALHIEAPLKEYGKKKKSLTDKEALLSLEYAKEKIKKGKGLIITPDEKSKPKNEIGEVIYQSIDKCRYEKKIILPGEIGTYKKEEKIQCLERIILSVKFLAREDFEGRKYIEQVIKRFSQIEELSRQKKINHIS